MKTSSDRRTSSQVPCTQRWYSGLALAFVLLIGAAPPEIKRVWVPSSKIQAWIPPGTPVRGIPTEAFEGLVRAASAGVERQSHPAGPRLLRARHSARWDAGVLSGRSELVVDPSGTRPARVELEPWAPAILPPEGGERPVRVDQQGRTALWIESPLTTNVVLDWQLCASPGSNGRSFRMAMPAIEPASLVLDLPAGWVPEGPDGIRQGPIENSASDRRTWRFDGRGGRFDLRLLDAEDPAGRRDGERLWVRGPTRVELRGASAHWKTDWTVEASPGGPRQLMVELDSGLDLVEVTGTGVEGVRPETVASATRIAISLARGRSGPTPVTIRAIARVPLEGAWVVPAARPLNAVWTGGTTTVGLDPVHVLEECRERAGRRTSPRSVEGSDLPTLVFEAGAPASVAELVFRKPRAAVSAEVRGRLLLGNSAPHLECRLTWQVDSGRLLDLVVDLPPAWTPDRIEIEGQAQPATWYSEVRPGGGARVHIVPPPGDWTEKSLSANLTAIATIAGGRGPLTLPRVRPSGVAVSDELWVALTDSSLTLRPEHARGLAWIDPALAVATSATNPPDPAGLREALAWRWLEEDAEARVDRDRLEADPNGTVHLTAIVSSGRLLLDWLISIRAGSASLGSIVLDAGEPIDEGRDWRFIDEDSGLEVAARPIDAARRTALGFPGKGQAWELSLPPSSRGHWTLKARRVEPWSGSGSIPLLSLPTSFQARGMVVVVVDRTTRTSVESEGLWRLDPEVAAKGSPTREPAESNDRLIRGSKAERRAHAFGYDEPGGRLTLKTETLASATKGVVIRRAVLTTSLSPGAASRQHLALSVVAERGQSLELSLPDGAKLQRVLRDGQQVTPAKVGPLLSIALPDGNETRSTCAIILEYQTSRVWRPESSRVTPVPPTVSSPCLEFLWQLVVPRPYRVGECGPELVATDPAPSSSWAGQILGAWDYLRDLGRPSPGPRDAAMLRSLDDRVGDVRARDVTLDEWFTRWDAGPWPVVIDRMALATAGFGPHSRFVPTLDESARSGKAIASLRPLGLTVVPIGDFLLVTTSAEAPIVRQSPTGRAGVVDPWGAALRKATIWGSDGSDRFQSVRRWRGDTTSSVARLEETSHGESVSEEGRVWRFAAVGWPGPKAWARLVDDRTRSAWSWLLGLGVLAAGLVSRHRPAPVRGAFVAAVMAIALAVAALDSSMTMHAAGAAAGAGAVSCVWLGQSLRQIGNATSRARRATSSARVRLGAPPAAVGLLLGLVLSVPIAVAQVDRTSPILALFPFDGPPDPHAEVDRVILRLEDYDRLKALAEAEAPASPVELDATAATHRISWLNDRDILAESTFVLVGAGGPAASWRFPVGEARELSAKLDDMDIPIFVERGGKTATVAVPRGGEHRLEIRRVATPQANGSGRKLSLPINSVATARIRVEGGGRPELLEVVGARGKVEPRPTGAEGALGPADRLEVRWSSNDSDERTTPRGSAEGLILWDAEPAGDHVRVRLTYRNPEGTPTVRLALEPGLILREVMIPGVIDPRWEGTAERPEWVASVDPPLPDGSTIGLEFWRPLPTPSSRELEGVAARPDGDPPLRRLPRIEPLGVDRYAGSLGFRRPADWSGRLIPGFGVVPISDEAFVKLWGNLPDEPLTLSGTTRFVRVPTVALPTRPLPDRLSVQPTVQLVIGPGRIEFASEADLIDLDVASHEAMLTVPPQLQLIRVGADGLTEWSRTGADRIRLRFDGPESRRRRVRIQGWLPVPSDPLATGALRGEASVPWPRWLGADLQPGTLMVSSPTPFQLAHTPGLTVTSSEQLGGETSSDVRYRTFYRVDRSGGPGRLSWEFPPPRAGVRVQSQLTIHPDSAEWVAALTYDVSGGAYDAIHLQLPTAWAARARVKLGGDGHQLTSVSRRDVTTWLIRPDPPIWGSRRLVVRSTLPLKGVTELTFPDLVPLGHGLAETTLAIANATGGKLESKSSPGLQPLDDSTPFRAREFLGFGDFPTRVFAVRREGWTLNVTLPSARPRFSEESDPRADLADVSLTLSDDGSVLGMALFEVEPHSRTFFPVDLPPRCDALWASVNGDPTFPLKGTPGHWFIPLDDQSGSRVELGWRTGAVDERLVGSRPLPLPTASLAGVTTFLTVFAPPSIDVRNTSGSFERVAPDRREIEGAEALARRIVKRLPELDRDSRRDREQLVATLEEFEAKLRRAERAASWEPTASRSSRDERVRRVRERVKVARSALREALQSAGLGESIQESETRFGPAGAGSGSSPRRGLMSAGSLRIPLLGRPADFFSESGERGPASSIVWTAIPPPGLLERSRAWVFLFAAIVTPLVAYFLVQQASRRGRWGLLALAVPLAALSVAGGPWMLGAGVVLAFLGWTSAS